MVSLRRSAPAVVSYSLLALSAGLIGFVVAAGGMPGALMLVVVAAACGLLGLLLTPLAWLPALALFIQAIVPAPPLAALAKPGVVTLAVAVLLVWAGRTFYERREDLAATMSWRHLVLPLALSTWLLVSCVTSVDPRPSLLWTYAFMTGVVIVAITPMDELTKRLLVRTWLVIGVVLAVHAIVEALTQSGFLYGAVYDSFGAPSVQKWSSYRAEASFRHPISAGQFLGTSTALAIGIAVRGGARWVPWSIPLLAAGTMATISRGPLIGMLAGFLIAMLLWSYSRFPRTAHWRYPAVGLVALLLGAALNMGPIADRLASDEATESASGRLEQVPAAFTAASSYPILGSGPATSVQVVPAIPGAEIAVESSLLQLMVSTGFVGLGLFLLLVGTAARRAARASDVGAVAALTCFVTGLMFFNAIEDRITSLAYLGLLLALCRSATPRTPAAADLAATNAGHAGPPPSQPLPASL